MKLKLEDLSELILNCMSIAFFIAISHGTEISSFPVRPIPQMLPDFSLF